MNMVDIAIIAVIAVAAFFGIRRMVGTATGRRDCCSGDAKSQARTFRATRITDTDPANYPYEADFRIGGMSCEGCAKNVTNALDSVKGTWATVDLDARRAHVRSKNPIDEGAYRAVVEEAGYRVLA